MGFRRYSRNPARRRGGGILDWTLTLGFFALLVFGLVRYGQIDAVRPKGGAAILDGDTILVSGQKIRLEGIDAPEFSQVCTGKAGNYACGKDAKRQLAALIGKGPVECSGWQNDKYGRLLGTCNSGEVDLNRQMVLSGWAVSYGDYFAEEMQARRSGKGLWQGGFDRPADWRKTHERASATDDTPHDFWFKLSAFLRQAFGLV